MSEISKAAIAGVWPEELGEAHITQTFPSISASGFGRLLGSLYSIPVLGFFIHIATLPLPILLALVSSLTSGFRRYELTSLRVRIRRGTSDKGPEVQLAEIDEVRAVERNGQAYYRAADLELVSGGRVALTLPGVRNWEAFRQQIIEARDALVQVRACRAAIESQTPATSPQLATAS